jgi:hypothetical protein
MRDDEEKLARAERLGRVFFDTRMIAVIVCPGGNQSRRKLMGLPGRPIVCAVSATP